MSGSTAAPPFGPKTAAAIALATVALVALAGTTAASSAPASTDNTTDPPEVLSVTEVDGVIEIAFDRPVRAADDGGDVDADDVEVYVRPAGAPRFDAYEDNFTVSSNGTTEGRVVLTNGSWGDLAPPDTAYVNFTTDLEATSTSTVASAPEDVYRATAGTDGDAGDLTRTDVVSAVRSYIQSGGQSVNGVPADRSDVVALLQFYIQQAGS